MNFSSPTFLFLFLPVVLALYVPFPRARNAVLLAASLLFYFWGEGGYLALLLGCVVANWGFGLLIFRAREAGRRRAASAWLAAAIVVNLGSLSWFKYAGFFGGWIAQLLPQAATGWSVHFNPADIHLPIGISFFTFQALSYVIDVHRNHVPAERGLGRLALYIACFPQLVAGPIVRYTDVAAALASRVTTRHDVAVGIRRFVVGLGKKVAIADVLSRPVDAIFALPVESLTTPVAWLGIAGYTLQIYYDFSGYSDMAIGLGRIFGFRFPENFDDPYTSRSMREFWRRWHISLSTWFRDYLYVPLGGNRLGGLRTHLNLLIVFFLCGLWHGASWNFVTWGLFHGAFLTLERQASLRGLGRAPTPVKHMYALGVVLVGWVFFRTGTLIDAADFLSTMFGLRAGDPFEAPFSRYWNGEVAFTLAIGVFAASSLPGLIARRWRTAADPGAGGRAFALLAVTRAVALLVVLVYSLALIAGGTYTPFIYFRF